MMQAKRARKQSQRATAKLTNSQISSGAKPIAKRPKLAESNEQKVIELPKSKSKSTLPTQLQIDSSGAGVRITRSTAARARSTVGRSAKHTGTSQARSEGINTSLTESPLVRYFTELLDSVDLTDSQRAQVVECLFQSIAHAQ